MKLWIKAAISLVVMAILLWRIDIDQMLSVFSSTNVELWLAAFALFLFQQVVVAYSWHILLLTGNKSAPFIKTLEVHFIGSFFGTFLPSSIGMDIIRAFRLGRSLERGVDAASTLFVVRVVGFLVIFFLALLVAIPASRSLNDPRLFWTVLIALAVFITSVWLLLHRSSIVIIQKLLDRIKLAGIAKQISGFRDGIIGLGRTRQVVTRLIALSFFYQILGIVIVYLVGRSLSIDLDIWHYFIYIPLITTIALIPISLAGIGVREGAFVFFFAQAGVAEAQALSMSIIIFAQAVCSAIVGGIWYFAAKESAGVNEPVKFVSRQAHQDGILEKSG